jgi:hypothetical protein
MLFPFVGRVKQVEVWQHYPDQDARDSSGRWQFYYHAHEAGDARHEAEHGHIHLFARDAQGHLTHLVGLALDARGVPVMWFCTNQWVTGEHWSPAAELIRQLQTLELRLRGPLSGVALWLTDMIWLYADELSSLLLERDAALAAHCEAQGLSQSAAFADRSVAVWSRWPISWPQDALRIAV